MKPPLKGIKPLKNPVLGEGFGEWKLYIDIGRDGLEAGGVGTMEALP
ncbi:MAG: hypothetical protein ACOYJD_07455 [Christensenellales bacterium]|jgi:hypothetical protein